MRPMQCDDKVMQEHTGGLPVGARTAVYAHLAFPDSQQTQAINILLQCIQETPANISIDKKGSFSTLVANALNRMDLSIVGFNEQKRLHYKKITLLHSAFSNCLISQ